MMLCCFIVSSSSSWVFIGYCRSPFVKTCLCKSHTVTLSRTGQEDPAVLCRMDGGWKRATSAVGTIAQNASILVCSKWAGASSSVSRGQDREGWLTELGHREKPRSLWITAIVEAEVDLLKCSAPLYQRQQWELHYGVSHVSRWQSFGYNIRYLYSSAWVKLNLMSAAVLRIKISMT